MNKVIRSKPGEAKYPEMTQDKLYSWLNSLPGLMLETWAANRSREIVKQLTTTLVTSENAPILNRLQGELSVLRQFSDRTEFALTLAKTASEQTL